MTRAPDLLLAAALHSAQRNQAAPPPETAYRRPAPRTRVTPAPTGPCGRPNRHGSPCDVRTTGDTPCWRHR